MVTMIKVVYQAGINYRISELLHPHVRTGNQSIHVVELLTLQSFQILHQRFYTSIFERIKQMNWAQMKEIITEKFCHLALRLIGVTVSVLKVSSTNLEEYLQSKVYKDHNQNRDHPCVYVATQNGQAVLSKQEYVPAIIGVYNCADKYRLTAPGGIKVRGNSTTEYDDEKPYRIKFEKKQNMLGLHEGKPYKSWVLLLSCWNLVPDYMAFNLAKTIFDGKYYSSDCIFVNLYINGIYRGIYLLCEQSQAARGRIDVNEPKKGEVQTNIGYLLELDNYTKLGKHPFFEIDEMPAVTDITGVSRMICSREYSIRSRFYSVEQEEFIHRYLDGVFTILYEAATTGKPLMLDEQQQAISAEGTFETGFDAVSAVMDLDSLANMLILEELVQNYDVGEGSFYMAVDFSDNSKYPRLTFLAPWDFEWGYEEDPEAGYYAATFQRPIEDSDRSNGWFILAMKLNGFQEIVKEKWRSFSKSRILNDTVDQVIRDCETLVNDLGKYAWKIRCAKMLGDYVRKRITWLDSQWL